MNKIKDSLQEILDEQSNGYQLKTNEEIINIISNFGCGQTEFHTADINRLVVENERTKKLIELFESSKTEPIIPKSHGNIEYNIGYSEAISNLIKKLQEIF